MSEKIILIANQKGGSGKSLVADELAFAFDRDRIPYSLYDMDQQGGLIHTARENEKAKVGIVDTPGALQKDMVDWMQSADLIIIPTKMTPRDIPPLETMLELIEKNGIEAPVLFVFNGWNRYNATQDFESWFLETYPKTRFVRLPQSEAFTQAALNEQSVVDYKQSSPAAQQILQLVQTVKSILRLK